MKNIIKLHLLLFIFTFNINCFAQLQDHVWYFSPTSFGFLFNYSTNTISITNVHQPMCVIGNSVATDKQTGNLLFYTNGISVWDKNHQIMPNGHNLSGGISCTQNGLICYYPGQPNKYYIFSNKADDPILGNVHYSIVDLALPGNGNSSNPSGDVITNYKNVFLSDSSDESMIIIPGKNNYWLLM